MSGEEDGTVKTGLVLCQPALSVWAGLLIALGPIDAFGVSKEVDVGEGERVFVGVEFNGVVEADARLRGCALC
jgi:hypothetical protein